MGQITLNDITIEYDDNLSFRNFTNKDMSGEDLSGKIIYSSVFYQEQLDSEIFHPELSGALFIKCNLDNVALPDGNTKIECQQRRIKAQNDLRDWIVDQDNKPIEPINKDMWAEQGFSVDPADIPAEILNDTSEIKRVG